MPPRKKVVAGTLAGVDKNHCLESSADHMSMHFEGVGSLGEIAHCESRVMMAATEDLQCA